MQSKYSSELKDLVNDFIMYSEQWLEKGIIDENTYKEIISKKIQFLEDIVVEKA